MKNIFDKNTLLGILLIFSMVSTYFWYQKGRIAKIQKQEKIAQKLSKKEDKNNSTHTPTLSKTEVTTAADTSVNNTTKPVEEVEVKGELVTLKNDLISLDINTAGAQIQNAILNDHKSYLEKNVQLLNEDNTSWSYTLKNNNQQFDTKKINFSITEKTDSSITLFSNGLSVIYTLPHNSYLLNQKWKVDNNNPLSGAIYVETKMEKMEQNLSRERMYSTINYLPQGEEVIEQLSTTKNENKTESNPTDWVSLGQQFFNVTIIPNIPISKGTYSSEYTESDTGYVKKYIAELELASQDNMEIQYFIGPNSYKLLKKEDRGLEKIIPLSPNFVLFRWFKIFNEYLIIPMFNFFSKYFSNYGVIIILMTLIIKLIVAPLSYKTYKSGVAMRVMKPELEKLKKKFGNDQQKFSQEQMKLYNKAGVNPMGGCLPMMLQMPILLAMFYFFPSSIELRHEAFLWAKDLSTFDNVLTLPFNVPLYGSHVSLFALLSAVTQLGTTIYSQRMQPSSPQADQMKMVTYIMPLTFLFIFNKFPAALTFYYFLQNIFSVLQQWFFTTFIIKEDKVREEIEMNKKKPKKQNAFQKKMADMMQQAEQQREMQQKNKK